MDLRTTGRLTAACISLLCAALIIASSAAAQEYKSFKSDKYGFTMKYPATWVKVENPKGNYYVVFQAPDLVDNFRNRIHVAAHKPVKDPIEEFLQEMRNGIKDLQKKSGKKQDVRIIDEGPFRADVAGAHYFFLEVLENKLKLDIVIVFYKHEETLLRVSCLAPSSVMEKMHQNYNDVLVSVKFPQESQGEASAGGPGAPETVDPAPSDEQPAAQPGQLQPRTPSAAPQPSAPSSRQAPPEQDSGLREQHPRAPQAPRGPVGPSRGPSGPATGIVQ